MNTFIICYIIFAILVVLGEMSISKMISSKTGIDEILAMFFLMLVFAPFIFVYRAFCLLGELIRFIVVRND